MGNCLANSTSASCSLRLIQNGKEIPGSQISTKPGIAAAVIPASRTSIISVASGDIIKVQFTASVAGGQLIINSAASGTIKPSITISMMRIS